MKIPLTKNPEMGLTMVEVMVALLVMLMLTVIVLPMFSKAKSRSSMVDCASNLKQAGLSFRLFAEDNGDKYPAEVLFSNNTEYLCMEAALTEKIWARMSNGLPSTKVLVCPEDVRKAARDFATLHATNISYFASVDASMNYPQVIESGDRNLQFDGKDLKPGLFTLYTNSSMAWSGKIHRNAGNVALSDGSVQIVSQTQLQGIIMRQGLTTNRLAFP